MVESSPFKHIKSTSAKRLIHCTANTAGEIWGDVFNQDLEDIQDLYVAMKKLTCRTISTPIFFGLAELLYRLSYKKHGRYIEESDYMAQKSGVLSPAQVAFLQRQYTLVHAALCSTTTAWDAENQAMVCMRSLDWPGAEDIAKCTRTFNFVNDEGKPIATVVGITGMIGVLTGVKQGFSIAANYAPWPISAKFRTDPTFLIRDLLQDETINSYDKAITAIKSWEIGAPCFITVCGVQKGEASVIEFGGGTKMYHRKADAEGLLVQTNHYSHEKFKRHNKKQYKKEPKQGWYKCNLLKNSEKRQQQILEGLQQKSKKPLESRLKEIYSQPPVMNYETAQWVIMRPSEGPLHERNMQIWTCHDIKKT